MLTARRRELCAVLGVPAEASQDEVVRAYRRLAKLLHPDVAGPDPVAAERFARVDDAYRALGGRSGRPAPPRTADDEPTPSAAAAAEMSRRRPAPIVPGPVHVTSYVHRRWRA